MNPLRESYSGPSAGIINQVVYKRGVIVQVAIESVVEPFLCSVPEVVGNCIERPLGNQAAQVSQKS
jgi:hypothetical protein